MEVLFNSRSKMQCHKPGSTKAFCCSQSKVILNVDDLDITLLHCLLINICVDLFWCSCLYKENKTLEKFLDDNNHVLFHLWKRNDKCCKSKESNLQCKLDLFGKINDSQWAKLFETTPLAVRCNNRDTCHFSVKKGIMEYNLDNELACVILGNICPLFMSIQKLSQSRNTLAHNKKGELSDMEYKTIWSVCTECILEIARFLGKENNVKGEIDVLKERIPSADVYKKLHSNMLDTYTLIEDISDKWNVMFIHESERKTDNVRIQQEITDLKTGVNQMNKGMGEVKQMLEHKKAMEESDRTNVKQLQDDMDKMKMMFEFMFEGTVSAGNQFQRKPITKKLEGAYSDDSDLDCFTCGTCNQLYMETSDNLILFIEKHKRECRRTQVRSTTPHTRRDDLQKTSNITELSIEGLSKYYEDETIQNLKATDGFENQEISIESVDKGSIVICGRISKAVCDAKTSVIDAVEDFLRTLFIKYPIDTDDPVNITVKVRLLINEGNELDEEGDYLLCGKCKSEFIKVSEYIKHQRTECKVRKLDKTEQAEAISNSSIHGISAGYVDQTEERFDRSTNNPVSGQTHDSKTEEYKLSKKEHIPAATKHISSPSFDIRTDRTDDMQAGTLADPCLDNFSSSINIESSKNKRKLEDQPEKYYEVEQKIVDMRPIQNAENSEVPQIEPLSSKMIQNPNGGFSYFVKDIIHLHRYFCLRDEVKPYDRHRYYVKRLIKEDKGHEVLKLLVDLSVHGRAKEQKTILHSLAICATCTDRKTKSDAYYLLPDVCRTPSHLFEFIDFCKKENSLCCKGSGWGRLCRSGISNWYNSFENNPKRLAYLITKYKTRHQWSHRDVLKLAHIKPKNQHIALIVCYITGGLETATQLAEKDTSQTTVEIMEFLVAVEKTSKNTKIDMEELKTLIIKHELVQEHIHNDFLNSKAIWECLLRLMPVTAMLRNLGKTTSFGLFLDNSFCEDIVINKLVNIMKEPRIHPLNVFLAWKRYMGGFGRSSHSKWNGNVQILDTLEKAIFKAFDLVHPTNKKICIAVEVSYFMGRRFFEQQIEALEVAVVIAILMARIERDCQVVAFTDRITCINIDKLRIFDNLISAIGLFQNIPYGGIDCALPIKWAVEEKNKFDAFIVFTTSVSFSGNIHFVEALRQYRIYSDNEDVRVVVVGMANNDFSIADPSDPLMLDIVGFDKNAPKAIQKFLLTD